MHVPTSRQRKIPQQDSCWSSHRSESTSMYVPVCMDKNGIVNYMRSILWFLMFVDWWELNFKLPIKERLAGQNRTPQTSPLHLSRRRPSCRKNYGNHYYWGLEPPFGRLHHSGASTVRFFFFSTALLRWRKRAVSQSSGSERPVRRRETASNLAPAKLDSAQTALVQSNVLPLVFCILDHHLIFLRVFCISASLVKIATCCCLSCDCRVSWPQGRVCVHRVKP